MPTDPLRSTLGQIAVIVLFAVYRPDIPAHGTAKSGGIAAITTETRVIAEISSTIYGGKFRGNKSFRDHVRLGVAVGGAVTDDAS
jgi:hypothetical protein